MELKVSCHVFTHVQSSANCQSKDFKYFSSKISNILKNPMVLEKELISMPALIEDFPPLVYQFPFFMEFKNLVLLRKTQIAVAHFWEIGLSIHLFTPN